MWNGIVDFLGSILAMFFDWTGNFGVAVILFTILVKALMLPLDLKSKNATAKMQALQPELQKIKDKYPNDQQKQTQKMQELYAKNHVSPLGGCLPLLITFPIIIIVFAALKKIAAEYMYNYMESVLIAHDGSLKGLLDEISAAIAASDKTKLSFAEILPTLFNNGGVVPSSLSFLPEIITQEKCDLLTKAIGSVPLDLARSIASSSGYSFLWIKNIWVADSALKSVVGTSIKFGSGAFNGLFILPVLSTATQYVQQFLMTRSQKKMQAAAPKSKNSSDQPDPTKSMGMVNKIMPLISLYFCTMYNAAFAIYWTVSNIIAIAQSLITDLIKKNKEKSEEVVK